MKSFVKQRQNVSVTVFSATKVDFKCQAPKKKKKSLLKSDNQFGNKQTQNLSA